MGREVGKLYQDPLYGPEVLSPLAVALIDTPEFQRLSRLRQPQFSDLVYPGANHTRFQHSAGATSFAGRCCGELSTTTKD
jgi:HD superfamily phosphohydrolase